MAQELQGKRIAIIATDGVEEVELTEPRKAVEEAGATAELISLEEGEIQAMNSDIDKAGTYAVDKAIGDASPDDYDALILPGGTVNADNLRVDEEVISFVQEVFKAGKPVGVICHGPWTLVEADLVRGRTLTSYPSIRTDIHNAGGNVVDEEVVVDEGLVSSRNPDDLPAFCAKIVEEFAEGAHDVHPERGDGMKALTWHGKRDVRVDNHPDPTIQEPTDAIIKVTTTGLCGSDLHLYEVLGPFLDEGDILGHEPMGIVEEVGSEVTDIKAGDRVVIPFNISCGHCFMCDHGLQTQCETTQNRDEGKGASLFGYTKLYGQVAGGQAEYLRVPQAHYGPIKVPEGPPDDRFVYMSDVLPTAWQAVDYCDLGDGPGSVAVVGLGPIGEMATRIAQHRGYRVLAVDPVAERRERAASHGVDIVEADDLVEAMRELTDGRGPDAVIDAVGMEAHGSPVGKLAHDVVGLLPDAIAEKMMERAGTDRLGALHLAIELVRRGGTVSLSGVYGGEASPMPLMTLFDKQVKLRMGQANVKRWIPDIMPLLTGDGDPLGVEDFATHRLPLEEAPNAYEMFQKKDDGAFKVVFQP